MEHNDLNFLIELKECLDREIITLTNILESKKEYFADLKNIIYKTCVHDWVVDFIDKKCSFTGNFVSNKISYCKKCNCLAN